MKPGNPIEGLAIARAMRENLWLYPSVEVVHIVGFAILVGAVVMFDLRVLGFSKSIPVRAMSRHLLPWSVGALLLIAVAMTIFVVLKRRLLEPPQSLRALSLAALVCWAGAITSGRLLAYTYTRLFADR